MDGLLGAFDEDQVELLLISVEDALRDDLSHGSQNSGSVGTFDLLIGSDDSQHASQSDGGLAYGHGETSPSSSCTWKDSNASTPSPRSGGVSVESGGSGGVGGGGRTQTSLQALREDGLVNDKKKRNREAARACRWELDFSLPHLFVPCISSGVLMPHRSHY